MTMDVGFSDFDQFMETVELDFNHCGNIPFLGFVTGPIRAIAGKIEIVAGLIFALYQVLKGVFSGDSSSFQYASRSIHYSFHGLLNLLRGVVESIPFTSIATNIYDKSGNRWSYIAKEVQTQI